MPKRTKVTRDMKETLYRLYKRFGTRWSDWNRLVIDDSRVSILRGNGLVELASMEDIPDPDGKNRAYRVTERGKELLERCGLI